MFDKQFFVYILGNVSRTALYIGITSDLSKRIWEHRNEVVEGFTKKYQVHELLYYEIFSDPESAIFREKQVKSWKRNKKEELILQNNPGLEDLSKNLI